MNKAIIKITPKEIQIRHFKTVIFRLSIAKNYRGWKYFLKFENQHWVKNQGVNTHWTQKLSGALLICGALKWMYAIQEKKLLWHQCKDQNCVICLLFWNMILKLLKFQSNSLFGKKKLVHYFRCPVYKFITCEVYIWTLHKWFSLHMHCVWESWYELLMCTSC